MDSLLFYLLLASALISCGKDIPDVDPPIVDPPVEMETGALYFPPSTEDEWSEVSMDSLGWDMAQLDELYEHLEFNNTRGFIILKDGKIVVEEYWGNDIFNVAPFTRESLWYWASAGKSLTATLVGIAQEDGYLDIDEKSSTYLGEGWTAMDREKEDLIAIKHQLTMTTGLEYSIDDIYCTDPECLTYRADAGSQWFYHNAPYTLLDEVLSSAVGKDNNDYTDEVIGDVIGMNGVWRQQGYNNTYWSSPRDMARFGLMILNEGTWDGIEVLEDKEYYNEMVNSSQELNPAYGYLWWLNGKSSLIYPGLSTSFDVEVSVHAPDDLIAAIGKNGQFIDVVPSQNLVVIRMGQAPDDSLVPTIFHDEMWELIQDVIGE